MGMKHEPIIEAWARNRKLVTEGDKHLAQNRIAESHRLFVEANRIYINAVIAKHGGKAIINWTTGEIDTSKGAE